MLTALIKLKWRLKLRLLWSTVSVDDNNIDVEVNTLTYDEYMILLSGL